MRILLKSLSLSLGVPGTHDAGYNPHVANKDIHTRGVTRTLIGNTAVRDPVATMVRTTGGANQAAPGLTVGMLGRRRKEASRAALTVAAGNTGKPPVAGTSCTGATLTSMRTGITAVLQIIRVDITGTATSGAIAETIIAAGITAKPQP